MNDNKLNQIRWEIQREIDGFPDQFNRDSFDSLLNEYAKRYLELHLHSVSGSLPLTFEQCLREEFLINTQNYPKEYHDLFQKKFNRAKRRFEEQ